MYNSIDGLSGEYTNNNVQENRISGCSNPTDAIIKLLALSGKNKCQFALDAGIDVSDFSKLCNGKRLCTLKQLGRIKDAMKLSPEEVSSFIDLYSDENE